MKPMSDYEFATFSIRIDPIVQGMLVAYLAWSELQSLLRKVPHDIVQHRHLFNNAILNLPVTATILPMPKKTSKVTIWIERDAEEALDTMLRYNLYRTSSVDAIINTALAQWLPEVIKREKANENQ